MPRRRTCPSPPGAARRSTSSPSVNPIYTDLRRGLIKYQQRWGSLPQLPIPAGPTLKLGTTGERVAMLRTRLGLPEGDEI